MGYRPRFFSLSRFTIWAERLAYIAMPLAIIAILVTRSGQVPALTGVVLLAVSALLSALALALVAVGLVDIWRHGHEGLGGAFRASVVASLVLAFPAYLAVQAGRLPRLNDISTDLVNPPRFQTSPAALRARGGHTPPDRDARLREPQRLAYPEIRPLVLEMDIDEAFGIVKDAAQTLKWRITVEIAPPAIAPVRAPSPPARTGRQQTPPPPPTPVVPQVRQASLEAVAETRLMRFQDDVVIRLVQAGEGTRVDIRSASRIGQHDFGTNAARIRRLIDEISTPRE
ncbi:Protein of unknown function DUF1499 [Rhabdaerophilaceae bacterium]